MSTAMYDVIIIGGGPGGYRAAERLGHRGKKTLLIEKGHLGGTCLNRGCIPTKTLLNSAKIYHYAEDAARFGINVELKGFDYKKMTAWKDEVVGILRGGVAGAMKRNKIEVKTGSAELVAPAASVNGAGRPGANGRIADVGGGHRVKIRETGEILETRAVIVATGSSSAMPPIPGTSDNPKVLDSQGLLELTACPKSIAVIGGGVIGLEFASLYATLGCKVTVIEMMAEIVPAMDRDLAPQLRKALKGVDFKLSCAVQKVDGGKVFYKDTKATAPAIAAAANGTGGSIGASADLQSVEAEIILLAVGRRPNTQGWGAEAIGLDIGPKGVAVADSMRTNVPGIWAVGDVTGKSLLAHSAYRMAEVAVEDICEVLDSGGGFPTGEEGEAINHAAGKASGAVYFNLPAAARAANRVRWDAIPWVVYSMPEAAGVGLSHQEAESRGIKVITSSVSLKVSGRFIAENGLSAPSSVKIIADAKTRRLLGVHMIGPYASEAIWGAAALIEQEYRIEDVQDLVFPHPTVGEAIHDAMWEFAPAEINAATGAH